MSTPPIELVEMLGVRTKGSAIAPLTSFPLYVQLIYMIELRKPGTGSVTGAFLNSTLHTSHSKLIKKAFASRRRTCSLRSDCLYTACRLTVRLLLSVLFICPQTTGKYPLRCRRSHHEVGGGSKHLYCNKT